MSFKSLVAAATICIAAATSAHAVSIEYDGRTYEVSTVTGTYNEHRDLLMSQIWWEPTFTAGSGSTFRPEIAGFFNCEVNIPVCATQGMAGTFGFPNLNSDANNRAETVYFAWGEFVFSPTSIFPNEPAVIYDYRADFFGAFFGFNIRNTAPDTTSRLRTTSHTWAVATLAAVPLPAGAPLLIAGLGGLALLKRRKTRAA